MSEGSKRRGLRDFFLLYAGQTLSQLGSSMTAFATVIWAYTKSGEVLASSLLAICSTVPYLIVSLLGGAVVDRGNKKRIMLICDTVAAVGSGAILACYWAGCLELWILCLCNVLGGFMNAFQTPASQVAVTLLVEEKDYARVGGDPVRCRGRRRDPDADVGGGPVVSGRPGPYYLRGSWHLSLCFSDASAADPHSGRGERGEKR